MFNNVFLSISKRVIKNFKNIVKFNDYVIANVTVFSNVSDLNKQSYLIKENFYEKYNDYLNINLFKQEWVFILEKKQHIKTLWLLSYHKNYYYIQNLFNLKQTNLYKQFNFKDITNKIKNNKNYLNIY